MKMIIIQAGVNDGDCVIKNTYITEEQLNAIKPIIKAIKENNGDYETGEYGLSAVKLYGDMEQFETFNKCVPFVRYGIHTIESITLLDVVNEEELLG